MNLKSILFVGATVAFIGMLAAGAALLPTLVLFSLALTAINLGGYFEAGRCHVNTLTNLIPTFVRGATSISARLQRLRRTDPRVFQIATLATLLTYGVAGLNLEVGLAQIVVTLTTALVAQAAFTKALGVVHFEAKSALISGLSLCLLLRTNQLGLA